MTKYNLDTEKSTFTWTGTKITGSSHTGTIDITKGYVEIEGDKLVGGDFEIDMNSLHDLDLDNEEYRKKLEGHLKSDDFFAVEQFPTATFKVTSFEDDQVSGDLTIKGKPNSITFSADITDEGNTIKAHAKFVIDRTKWDVRFGSGKFFKGLGDNLIKDEIGVELELVAKKT